MKKKFLVLAVLASLIAGVVMPVASVSAGEAPSSTDACVNYKGDRNSAAYKSICGDAKGEAEAEATVSSVLNTVFLWTGIIAVIVIIVGGVFYMTSQGDPGKVARAKNAILYAVIGLLVVLLSFAIVNFVLTNIG